MPRQPARGKRRAEPARKRRRSGGSKPKGGKRADRPQNHEGITPEFLERLREVEVEVEAQPERIVPGGVGAREVLAGIDGELRADPTYQHALSRLAYG